MKFKRKSKLKIMLVMLLMLAMLLCACTDKTPKPTPGPEPAPGPKTAEAEAAKALYEQFLKGETYVTMPDNLFVADVEIVGNKEFTIQDMVNAFEMVYRNAMLDFQLRIAEYAYIDCGLDGIPELAIKLSYQDANEPDFDALIQFVVIKAFDGQLKSIMEKSGYYRSVVDINSAGYITEGGSLGAKSSYSEYSFIDAKGKLTKMYSCSVEGGQPEPIVDPSYVTLEQNESLQPIEYYDDEGFNMYVFNFNTIELYDDFNEYEAYMASNMFAFEDYDYNPVMPSDENMELYSKIGVNVYSMDQIDEFVEQRKAELGFTYEMLGAPDPDWAEIDGVYDMLSSSAQIETLVKNKSVWYLPESEIAKDAYVYYAVGDLDRNGRLDIIRCERSYEPEDFCKNRFFEVDYDFKSVYKLDYDVETMYSYGEKSGYSPDIMDNESLYCFYDYDFGTALDDYKGTRYFYWAEDTMNHSEGSLETQMTFSIANDGEVHTLIYGQASTNLQGKTTYMDELGTDCDKQIYDIIRYRNFTEKDGWNCDEVSFDFIMLRDNDSESAMAKELGKSYKNHTIENVYYAEWNYFED